MPDIKVDALTTVYPSELDVAETAGEGNIGTEKNVSNLHQFSRPRNHVIPNRDGNGIPESDAGLVVTAGAFPDINISAGECWIDGYRFVFSGVLVDTGGSKFTITDEKHNWLFIRVEKDGSGRVDKAVLEISAVDPAVQFTWPTESVPIANVVATGGAITEIWDLRPAAFDLPFFIEWGETTYASTSFTTSGIQYLFAPIFGKFTTIMIPLNVGASSAADRSATLRIKVTGPNGSVTGTELTSNVLTVDSDYSEIITPTVNVDNTIGRFMDLGSTATQDKDGFLKIEIEGKTSAGGASVKMTNEAASGAAIDLRGSARFKEWETLF